MEGESVVFSYPGLSQDPLSEMALDVLGGPEVPDPRSSFGIFGGPVVSSSLGNMPPSSLSSSWTQSSMTTTTTSSRSTPNGGSQQLQLETSSSLLGGLLGSSSSDGAGTTASDSLAADGSTQVHESPRASDNSLMASAEAHSLAMQLANELTMSGEHDDGSRQKAVVATCASRPSSSQTSARKPWSAISEWRIKCLHELTPFFCAETEASRSVAVLGVHALSARDVLEACGRAGTITAACDEFQHTRGAVFVKFADIRDAARAARLVAGDLRRSLGSGGSVAARDGAVARVVASTPMSPRQSLREALLLETRSVVVTGLPAHTTETDLAAVFKHNDYGDVEFVAKLGPTGRGGASFSVTFFSRLDAERAVKELDDAAAGGRAAFLPLPDEAQIAKLRDFAALVDSWRADEHQLAALRDHHQRTTAPGGGGGDHLGGPPPPRYKAFVSMVNSLASARHGCDGDNFLAGQKFDNDDKSHSENRGSFLQPPQGRSLNAASFPDMNRHSFGSDAARLSFPEQQGLRAAAPPHTPLDLSGLHHQHHTLYQQQQQQQQQQQHPVHGLPPGFAGARGLGSNTASELLYDEDADPRRKERAAFTDAASLVMLAANAVTSSERDALLARGLQPQYAHQHAQQLPRVDDPGLSAWERGSQYPPQDHQAAASGLYADAQPWTGSYGGRAADGLDPTTAGYRAASPQPVVLRPLGNDDRGSRGLVHGVRPENAEHLRATPQGLLGAASMVGSSAPTGAALPPRRTGPPKAAGGVVPHGAAHHGGQTQHNPRAAAGFAPPLGGSPASFPGQGFQHLSPQPSHQGVSPAQINADFAFDVDRVSSGSDVRTTLMVRNIPNKYTQQAVLDEINIKFQGCYDFFYLPIDFKNKCNVGYAFINLIEPLDVARFYREFNGRRWSCFRSGKVCAITYARIQGRQSMITRFQNSSLLNEALDVQPRLFYSSGPNKGLPEPFPGCLPAAPVSVAVPGGPVHGLIPVSIPVGRSAPVAPSAPNLGPAESPLVSAHLRLPKDNAKQRFDVLYADLADANAKSSPIPNRPSRSSSF